LLAGLCKNYSTNFHKIWCKANRCWWKSRSHYGGVTVRT